MKNRILVALPLAALLALPAVAQSSSTQASQTPAATQSQQAPAPLAQQDTTNKDNPDLASGKQPLTYENKQGFWGKINPFARKKYVEKQLSPVRDRVNELDELTASNTKLIKDVDSRAQDGIRQANAAAATADGHAVDAGNRAQQANQTAQQATQRLGTVEQVVGSLDQYKPATQVELLFRPGQLTLSQKSKDALDQIAGQLSGKRGYVLEVQGFSSGKGIEAVRNSQQMAESVVRYMVLSHDVPVYRIYTIGMGNAPAQAAADGSSATPTRRTRGGRVEISLMTNGVDQLSAMNSGAAVDNSSSYSTSSPSSTSTPSDARPQSDTSAPASTSPATPASPTSSAPSATSPSAPAAQPQQPVPPAKPPQF